MSSFQKKERKGSCLAALGALGAICRMRAVSVSEGICGRSVASAASSCSSDKSCILRVIYLLRSDRPGPAPAPVASPGAPAPAAIPLHVRSSAGSRPLPLLYDPDNKQELIPFAAGRAVSAAPCVGTGGYRAAHPDADTAAAAAGNTTATQFTRT